MKHFIHTNGGGRFIYGSSEADVTIADVAHHLSNVARFCGATKNHYSVAQHSVLVAHIAKERYGARPELQRACLFHDAHEAYMSDLPTPYQSWVQADVCHGGDFIGISKDRLDDVIMPKLGIDWPMSEEDSEIVRLCDKHAFITEASQLFNEKPDWLGDWLSRFNINRPFDFTLPAMLPSEAKKLFLDAYQDILNAEAEDQASPPRVHAA